MKTSGHQPEENIQQGTPPTGGSSAVQTRYKTALDVLISIANDERVPADIRLKAAEAVLPYRHPKIREVKNG